LTGYDKKEFPQIIVQKQTKENLEEVKTFISKVRDNGGPEVISDGNGGEVRLKNSYDGAIRVLFLNIRAFAKAAGFSGNFEALISYGIRPA
jgi:hypothetical protein